MLIDAVYLSTCALLVFAGYILWRKYCEMKVPQDPWESEGIQVDDDDSGVCVQCLTPVKDRHQHYCPNCGFVTGEYTRYIPYINIKFNYSIFAKIAKRFYSGQD